MLKFLISLAFVSFIALAFTFTCETQFDPEIPEFIVGNDLGESWIIDGCRNPSLTLFVGRTYTFHLVNFNSYPLNIADDSGSDITAGVAHLGKSTVTYTPNEEDVGETRIYYCPLRRAMIGKLTIVDPLVNTISVSSSDTPLKRSINDKSQSAIKTPTGDPPMRICSKPLYYPNGRDITVHNYRSTSWVVEGCPNVPILVEPGEVYRFVVTNWEYYPLYVRWRETNITTIVDAPGTKYVTFRPTETEMGVSFTYYCTKYSIMAGVLRVRGNEPLPSEDDSAEVEISMTSIVIMVFILIFK
jgi:hypothetical protein